MMRKTLTLTSVVFLSFLSLAAIKFFSDYPNAVPVGSDFFVLQRNQSYINASRDQVKNDWFTSPVFTGNGLIGGNWSFGGVAYGNGGGLTNVPGISGNFFAATNGVGQNPTFYGGGSLFGTYFFDEVDAANMYITNFFTGKTNAVLLSTDGNGEFVATDFTHATNNDTKISTDGTNNVLAFSNNITAGISAALVSATNKFSGDGSGLTNLTYEYKTNAVSNGVLAFNGVGQAYRTNFNADITIASLTLGPNGASTYESLVLLCTNSDTSVHKITWPSGVFSGGVAAVSWITNGYWNEVVVDHFATLYTNAQVKN